MQYTEVPEEMAPDTVPRGSSDLRTLAEAVLLLRDTPGAEPRGMLTLQFVHPRALSRPHLDMLERFGRTLAGLLEHQGKLGTLQTTSAVEHAHARLGEAFGFVRHSLRNKLGAIRQFALEIGQPAVDQAVIKEKILARLTDADREIARARNLVKAPHPTDINLTVLWQSVRHSLHDLAAGHRCTIAPGNFEIETLKSDPEMVEAILTALAENAVLHAGNDFQVTASSQWLGDGVAIDVADTGRGLAKGVREHLFEIGTSTRADSTGAGLFLSQSRAQALGGRLEFVDRSPPGVTFRLLLPFSKTENDA